MRFARRELQCVEQCKFDQHILGCIGHFAPNPACHAKNVVAMFSFQAYRASPSSRRRRCTPTTRTRTRPLTPSWTAGTSSTQSLCCPHAVANSMHNCKRFWTKFRIQAQYIWISKRLTRSIASWIEPMAPLLKRSIKVRILQRFYVIFSKYSEGHILFI